MTREEYEGVYSVSCHNASNGIVCDINAEDHHIETNVHVDSWKLDGDIYSEGTTTNMYAEMNDGVCQKRRSSVDESRVVLDCDV